MKRMILMAAIAVIVVAPAWAFHDGGVAHCNSCHTMHNSQDGELVDPDSPNGNPFLLVESSSSDVCLNCHATRLGNIMGGGATADPLAPGVNYGGGQFIHITEDNLNDGHGGATDPIPGDAGGHNIISEAYGIAADATLTMSPGGNFPSSIMSCGSCHDPHGNANFRLLNDSMTRPADFTTAAPTAVGLAIFGGGEGPSNHTAYNSGMSAWCGNCHGDFHNNSTKLIHKSGTTMGGTVAQTYNLYNGSDDLTGGSQATAYLPEVAFEDAANTTSSTSGPSAASQVSCITCHRAHASSAPDAGRWDFNVTFLHEDGVESGSYQIPDPYNSMNQRSLCNKCHGKDVYDQPYAP